MIDVHQLRDLVRRILRDTGTYSPAAVNLLLGTAAQESRLGTFLRQIGGGPALGIMQMEPATERDIWSNYLSRRGNLSGRITAVTGHSGPGPWLEWDLAYQIAMARVHYLRVPEPLPAAGDVVGLAGYWKQHYNTPAGAGDEQEFIENYLKHLGGMTWTR